MVKTHNLGFPSIGHRRELKAAIEAYWQGKCTIEALFAVSKDLRAKHWQLQKGLGLDFIPVGDFSYYDRMLDTTVLLGAVPKRYGFNGAISLDDYFLMARGDSKRPAMEMTKWFDTNYHYIVPEFTSETKFNIQPEGLLAQLDEAVSLGIPAKVVLIGPLTFLYLGKEKEAGFNRLSLLPEVIRAYQDLLQTLKKRQVSLVQIEEPALVLDLPEEWVKKLPETYAQLSANSPELLLSTYFESVDHLAGTLKGLPVQGIHLDLVRAPQQLDSFLQGYPSDKVLSLGIVDGRNIWKTDLEKTLTSLEKAHQQLKDNLWLAPSCSLLHVPVDLKQETQLDEELKSWLAFGEQRLEELSTLKRGLNQGKDSIRQELQENRKAVQSRTTSKKVHNPAVQERMAKLDQVSDQRISAFPQREASQQKHLNLPSFPTTTIGSFPQTKSIREARAAFKKGKLGESDYQREMQKEIQTAIERQEEIGLDVLVHGEAERNDMVEFFGEQLVGFAFTKHGWVQSYGTRCVKPPIIYGDVYRQSPMTVEWITYAQSLTEKPVKGMLTGPVTILQWSFYRNDQSREKTAYQIGLAIRDEVQDLEAAGISIIQIDEPAYREGLPLKREQWDAYMAWASRAFRLSASGVQDNTQIHTHMCYSEFNDIFPGILALDADVITIEASRSALELLKGFANYHYPNQIGPGVYDVHSPAVPSKDEMVETLHKAASVLKPSQLWVNPDCGLKTRAWEEVTPALQNMVAAAKALQNQYCPV